MIDLGEGRVSNLAGPRARDNPFLMVWQEREMKVDAGEFIVRWPGSFWPFMFRCSNSDSGQDKHLLALPQCKREGSGKGNEKEGRKKGLLPHLSLDFYL